MQIDISEVNGVVRFAGLLLIGVVILAGINNSVSTQMVSTISLTFTGQPSDGDTVTLGGHVFEFDTGDGVVSGRRAVTIGATVVDTISNFETAVGSV